MQRKPHTTVHSCWWITTRSSPSDNSVKRAWDSGNRHTNPRQPWKPSGANSDARTYRPMPEVVPGPRQSNPWFWTTRTRARTTQWTGGGVPPLAVTPERSTMTRCSVGRSRIPFGPATGPPRVRIPPLRPVPWHTRCGRSSVATEPSRSVAQTTKNRLFPRICRSKRP